MHEADVGTWHIIVDWCNFMREECQVWLTSNNEIGGMDADGEPIVVEIDEGKNLVLDHQRKLYIIKIRWQAKKGR